MQKPNIMCALMCQKKHDIDLMKELDMNLNADDDAMNDYTLAQIEADCWEVGDVLRSLFDSSKSLISKLKKLIELNAIRVYIDVCIVHYDNFPALIFEEENMAIIRELQADIAIDMY